MPEHIDIGLHVSQLAIQLEDFRGFDSPGRKLLYARSWVLPLFLNYHIGPRRPSASGNGKLALAQSLELVFASTRGWCATARTFQKDRSLLAVGPALPTPNNSSKKTEAVGLVQSTAPPLGVFRKTTPAVHQRIRGWRQTCASQAFSLWCSNCLGGPKRTSCGSS